MQTICIQLVWWELFELNWFHLTCIPKYTKTLMVLISMACTEWCWSTRVCLEQNWYPLQISKLEVKAGFTKTCPIAACCSAILSFQTSMDAILINNMRRGVCGLSQSFQWCSNVGCKSSSISSGITLGSFNYFSSATPVYPASIRWVFAVTHLVNKTLINGKDNTLIIYEQTDITLS